MEQMSQPRVPLTQELPRPRQGQASLPGVGTAHGLSEMGGLSTHSIAIISVCSFLPQAWIAALGRSATPFCLTAAGTPSPSQQATWQSKGPKHTSLRARPWEEMGTSGHVAPKDLSCDGGTSTGNTPLASSLDSKKADGPRGNADQKPTAVLTQSWRKTGGHRRGTGSS